MRFAPSDRKQSGCALIACPAMPAGDTIDDVRNVDRVRHNIWQAVYDGDGGLPQGDCLTQLPFYGIAFRWFVASTHSEKSGSKGGRLRCRGRQLLQEAAELRTDVIVSVRRSAVTTRPSAMHCRTTAVPESSRCTWCASDRHPAVQRRVSEVPALPTTATAATEYDLA